MTSDYDKQQWQAEQAARDIAIEAQREKDRKTRERAARNARRKLERLHTTLTENGEITDFENDFGKSVLDRLDKFGAAFHDLEKGRSGDALSFAQKSVIAAMNKKVKSLKKRPASQMTDNDFEAGYERTADRWKTSAGTSKKTSSFSSKKAPKFTPRIRRIEDDFAPDDDFAPGSEFYLPQYISEKILPNTQRNSQTTAQAKSIKPFLRLVK